MKRLKGLVCQGLGFLQLTSRFPCKGLNNSHRILIQEGHDELTIDELRDRAQRTGISRRGSFFPSRSQPFSDAYSDHERLEKKGKETLLMARSRDTISEPAPLFTFQYPTFFRNPSLVAQQL
jgi:hypothetical protein